MDKKKDELNDLKKDATAKVTELTNWKTIYAGILSDLTLIIASIEENVTIGSTTTTDANNPSQSITTANENIDKYLKRVIEAKEAELERDQQWLDNTLIPAKEAAEYQLKQYEELGKVTGNPKQAEKDFAEANLDQAKQLLQFLLNRANELEALYKDAQNRYKDATSNK